MKIGREILREYFDYREGSLFWRSRRRDLIGREDRIENLRDVSASENSMHRRRQDRTRSGYKGVYYEEKRDRYLVRAVKDGKRFYLGQSKCAHKAARIYNERITEIHGEFAVLNKIKENRNEQQTRIY